MGLADISSVKELFTTHGCKSTYQGTIHFLIGIQSIKKFHESV